MNANELQTIEALADQVFGSHEKANRWFHRANKRLNGQTPIDLLQDESGANLIRQMLYQIDEGMFV